ncbi:MAG: family 16 glycoside hydrolase [Planctomycetota bacterium]|jgi:putative heme-binding domain-containing protein
MALRFMREGAPDPARGAALARRLEQVFPAGESTVDRVLVELLVFLDSPSVVATTLALMERADDSTREVDPDLLSRSDQYGQVVLRMAAAPPQRQQVHYALALCRATEGWTDDLRIRYFRWFDSARRASGGLSFTGFLDKIRGESLATLSAVDRARYESLGAAPIPGLDPADLPRGPGRAWRVEDVVARLDDLNHRDFERGAALYRGASCSACHRLSGTGGIGGPDLTGIGTRFSHRDLIATIIEPSREISDQYQQEEIRMTNGTMHIGRVVDTSDTHLTLMTSLLSPDATTEIEINDIASREPSPISPMMANLLDQLAPGEVLDLMAYMLSGADPRSDLFVPADAGDFEVLFDGRSLRGWKADSTRWSVEEGAIVGRSTAEEPLTANEFLVLRRDLPADFELRADVQFSGENNSGIQYRSTVESGGRMIGKQCDIHPNPPYHGMLYEEGGRGIVAQQGERISIGEDGSRRSTAGAIDALDFRPGAWHTYTIIARGPRVEHRVNGTVTCVVVDEQSGAEEGDRLGLQLHAGKPYEVRFRNIVWRPLGE